MNGRLAISMALWAGGVAVFSSAGACGSTEGSDAGAGDASAAVDADAAMVPLATPTAPALPAMVNLLPCPPGWDEVYTSDSDDVLGCDPWPEEGMHRCPVGQVHLPGADGCTPLGARCPDAWPDDEPDDMGDIYVSADARDGDGDGSRARPYPSITVALSHAAAFDRVLVGPGTYVEALTLRASVAVVGACPEETILDATMVSGGVPAVVVVGTGSSIENMRIRSKTVGVVVGADTSVTIDSVSFEGLADSVALVEGDLTMHRVSAVAPPGSDSDAPAIAIENGGTATLEAAALVGFPEGSILVRGRGSDLSLTRSVLVASSTWVRGQEGVGFGLHVRDRAHATLGQIALLWTGVSGVFATTGASLRGVDVFIEGLPTAPGRTDGVAALVVSGGASADLSRTWIVEPEPQGIFVAGAESALRVTDLIISAPWDIDGFAVAMSAIDGATCSFERLLVEESLGAALHVAGDGTSLMMTDAFIRHTASVPDDGDLGMGLLAGQGTRVVGERVRFLDHASASILVSGADVSLVDLSIEDTFANQGTGDHGVGIAAIDGAQVVLGRLHLRHTLGTGLLVFDEDTRVSARQLHIEETLFNACSDESCVETEGGVGLGLYGGAVGDVEGFLIEGSILAGAQVAHGAGEDGAPLIQHGELDLSFGTFRGNETAIHLSTDEYDLDRLTHRVRFIDNRRNVDASRLAPPALPDFAGAAE